MSVCQFVGCLFLNECRTESKAQPFVFFFFFFLERMWRGVSCRGVPRQVACCYDEIQLIPTRPYNSTPDTIALDCLLFGSHSTNTRTQFISNHFISFECINLFSNITLHHPLTRTVTFLPSFVPSFLRYHVRGFFFFFFFFFLPNYKCSSTHSPTAVKVILLVCVTPD